MAADEHDRASSPDWDMPGVMSIIVQGGLTPDNMVETANHCRHWRMLFPAAEIVLALSGSDIVGGERGDSGELTNPRLVGPRQHDGLMQAALAIIVNSCDVIGLAEAALPLPPIKADSPKLNNINLQIAAAQLGFKLISGLFVLRVRSDLIFADRSFLDQYLASEREPRGAAAMFARRVLISWLYTLNPYTIERMPLHFSDWLHFGLAEDVRRIWAAPPVSLSDSVFYKTHPHAPHSNTAERLFNIRIAVEQHLIYHCFKPAFPDLILDHHNDQSSVTLSTDILIDNFAMCDLLRAHCIFDKYSGEFYNYKKQFHCITPDDWFALARSRGADPRATLSAKIREARSPLSELRWTDKLHHRLENARARFSPSLRAR